MKLALLVALAACQPSVSDYPYGPGGDPPKGGGPSSPGIDASVDANDGGDGGAQITGRVCLLNDLRRIGATRFCAPNGLTALQLVVSLGPRTATPADDGTFTIQPPAGAGFTWHVASASARTAPIMTSAMPFGTDNTIPAVTFDRYMTLQQNNGVQLNDLEGSVIVRVIDAVGGVAQVQAATTQTDTPLLYDAPNSAEVWGTLQTDALGIVWVPSVPVQNPVTQAVPITLSRQGVIVAQLAAIIENQTITFLTQELR